MTLHDGGPIGMKSFLMIGIHQVLETAWRLHHIDYPCLVVMNMVKYTSSFQSGLLFIRPFCFWTSFKHCSTHTTCYTVYLGRYFFKVFINVYCTPCLSCTITTHRVVNSANEKSSYPPKIPETCQVDFKIFFWTHGVFVGTIDKIRKQAKIYRTS